MRILVSFLLLLVVFSLTECSHFQGGATYWEVFEDNGGTITVKITSQTNYPASYTSGYASFSCFEAPPYNTPQIGSFGVDEVYVDNDNNDNWSMLQGSTYITATEGSWCKLRFDSCCWIGGLYQSGSSWSLPVYINLERRSGKINSSPIAVHPPLARFVLGCPDTLVIPMVDEDGDHVTCRYANDFNEGGDMYMTYPYFSLDSYSVEGECRISYNGGGSTTKVGIALIIEDHPSSTSNDVLSYSSLQFVIEVEYLSYYSCSDKPSIVSPSPINNQIFLLSAGEDWQTTITIHSPYNIYNVFVVGVNGSQWQGTTYIGNNQYQVTISWSPTPESAGFNYMCYSAKDALGLITNQRCLQLYVDDVDPCEVNNGGCSDICSSSGGLVTCSCSHACWELAADGLRCLPQMASSCSDSRMTIRVDNCAYDQYIGVGDYPDYHPETNPIECWGNQFSSYYEFDFGLTECGTVTVEKEVLIPTHQVNYIFDLRNNMNEVQHKNTVKMFVDSTDGNSLVSRGGWYLVETTCTTEKYFEASGSFDPQDTHTTIVADEEGFAEIEITFDFYTDSSFSMAYSPYDYPLVVDINDDVYFGILAQTTDNDVELFTTSCVAKPDPDPYNIGIYTMIDEGCLKDETMEKYPTTNPLINQFSVKAFQFQNGLPGINENTNVVIQCEVVICSSQFSGTRCSEECLSEGSGGGGSGYGRSMIYRLPPIGRKQSKTDRKNNDDDDDNVTAPERDLEHAQTDTIPLLQSAGLQILGLPPTNQTETQPTNPPETQPTNPPEIISTTSKAPGTFPKLFWIVCGFMALVNLAVGTF